HFYAVSVEFPDQLLELRSLPVVFYRRSIAGIRRKKAYCIVAPVIQERSSVHFSFSRHFIKLKNRHQLHRVDAQFPEIRDLFLQSPESTSMGCARGRILGKSSYMQL